MRRAGAGQPDLATSRIAAGFIPVVAPAGKAFVAKGTTIVCHGGDSLEELAVPFVLVRTAEGGQV